MASYVIESVDEAAKKTRELLLPFDLTTWGKLAVIVLLTGGIGFSFPGFPGMGGGDYDGSHEMHQTGMNDHMSPMGTPAEMTGSFGSSSILALGVAVLIGIGLLVMFVSSVFEFIYYRSLLDERVEITGNFSNNIERGARYFNFRVLYTLGLLLMVGIAAGFVMLNPLVLLPLILMMLPLVLLLYAFDTLVHDFVLLEMLEEERNFIESLKQVHTYVKGNVRETVLYLFVRMAITLLATTAIGLGTLLLLMIVSIPLIFVGAILYMVSELLLIPLLLLGLLLVFVITLLVTVPMKTFIYYYAITVFEDFSEE